ncbi:MAG TPA: thioredoxin family protein [Amoebophilaceae bacterium]|jgi:thioredoxin 1|nr:thioredoxin family protein [Amoebophilaceae bacterium]
MRTNVVTVTDELFPTIIGQNKLVLMDFWASWCGPCIKLMPVLEQLADLYVDKAVIGKLDIDQNMTSSQKYNIKTIPTIVVFQESVEVERLSGSHPLETLQQILDRYIH